MDASVFLHARILDGSGYGRPMTDVDQTTPAKEGETYWHHLDVNNSGARAWLHGHDELGHVVQEALTVSETRPRAFAANNGLFVVLRGVNTNPGDDPEDMVAIRIWLDANRIISSRRRQLLAIKDIVGELDAGVGPRTSTEFLVSLVEKLADRIGDFVNDIEDRLEDAEEKVIAESAHEFRARLGLLRRQMAMVRRFMAPQRDALDRLYRQPVSWMSDHDTSRLREESDRFTRYLEDLDLARERAIVLQEEYLSQIAQQQNTRMYVLSIIAAIFLPLTFVTGLLGMNVGGLPGLESPSGFWIAVASMLLASGALIVFLRLKKWM